MNCWIFLLGVLSVFSMQKQNEFVEISLVDAQKINEQKKIDCIEKLEQVKKRLGHKQYNKFLKLWTLTNTAQAERYIKTSEECKGELIPLHTNTLRASISATKVITHMKCDNRYIFVELSRDEFEAYAQLSKINMVQPVNEELLAKNSDTCCGDCLP